MENGEWGPGEAVVTNQGDLRFVDRLSLVAGRIGIKPHNGSWAVEAHDGTIALKDQRSRRGSVDRGSSGRLPVAQMPDKWTVIGKLRKALGAVPHTQPEDLVLSHLDNLIHTIWLFNGVAPLLSHANDELYHDVSNRSLSHARAWRSSDQHKVTGPSL
ncbi:hypothetical protein Daesc_002751 [Daldinia eschscholtzii]|uniref:Uncharacterized protein n=1 Tax=Daldinia eschscholtzii TaxID=292717 RepID=A0AAX6MSH0_9PEZI